VSRPSIRGRRSMVELCSGVATRNRPAPVRNPDLCSGNGFRFSPEPVGEAPRKRTPSRFLTDNQKPAWRFARPGPSQCRPPFAPDPSIREQAPHLGPGSSRHTRFSLAADPVRIEVFSPSETTGRAKVGIERAPTKTDATRRSSFSLSTWVWGNRHRFVPQSWFVLVALLRRQECAPPAPLGDASSAASGRKITTNSLAPGRATGQPPRIALPSAKRRPRRSS